MKAERRVRRANTQQADQQCRYLHLDQRGEPVPVGVIGELWVGGDSLARGYLNRPELSGRLIRTTPKGHKEAEEAQKAYEERSRCLLSHTGTA